jgi:hypothetical protein
MDNPKINHWGCHTSSPLYNSKVASTIKQVTDIDVNNKDKYATTQYCEVTYKSPANQTDLITYSQNLNVNDPVVKDMSNTITTVQRQAQNLQSSLSREQTNHGQTRGQLASAQWERDQARESARNTALGLQRTIGDLNTRLEQQRSEMDKIAPYSVNRWGSAGQNYVLKSGDRCLDVGGWATHNNAYVLLYDCHWGGNQRWRMDEKNRLINKHSGKCLTFPSNPDNGARLVIQDCTMDPKMRWFKDKENRLRNQANIDRCIDVWGANSANGQPVVTYDCHDGWNQKWTPA